MVKTLVFMLAALTATGQQADSVKIEKQGSNMMLNAESATVPREINIGLPAGSNGATAFIDGANGSYALPNAYQHWVGSNGFESAGSVPLMETVIRLGNIGIMVKSNTRLGTEQTKGTFTAGTSTNGLIRFDGSLTGPLSKAKGWYYSLGAFINYDPTNVNTPSRKFVEQMQMYQASLSKRWTNSSIDFIYRLSHCNTTKNTGYTDAPFIYNGDGSISSLNGFRIGKDCYFPADDAVKYMDLQSGQMRSAYMSDIDNQYFHDFTVKAKHAHWSGWDFDGVLHACFYQPSTNIQTTLAGLLTQDKTAGMTLSDGSAYDGMVQKRLALVNSSRSIDVELLLRAERVLGNHKISTGLSMLYLNQMRASSTFNFAHTATADPERILYKGEGTWGLNSGARYHDGWKAQAFVYAIHDWQVTERFKMRTGLLLKPLHQRILTACEIEGSVLNKRVSGFNIADKSLCSLQELKITNLDWAVSEHLDFRIVDRLFFMAEGFYNVKAKGITEFRSYRIPSMKPGQTALGRAGFTYDNKWMDIAALFSFIRTWNNSTVISVVDPVGGDTIPWTAEYGISTPGFTLDGNVHFGGFNMHALFTWQDPRYKNYDNEFKWDDGTSTKIAYTDKYVTGISQCMLELDPSYSWKKVKLWASVRYYSRQYVSRTNLAYYNGHWETFAGVKWDIGKGVNLAFNIVNPLFDKGAKGSIDAVDTIEDVSLLQNLPVAGTYIRPFTVDMMVTYKF